MDTPTLLDFLLQMAAPAFFALLFLAALGATVWAGLAHARGTMQNRVFCELMARQMTGMAWPHLLLTLAAGAFWVWSLGKHMAWLPGRFLSGPMLAALIAALAALVLCLVANAAWKALQGSRGLRMVLCLAACLAALAGIYLLTAGLKDVAAAMLGDGQHALPAKALYLPGRYALFWPALAGLTFLALTAGSGLGQAWMALRRNRDDFGRDYYNYALPRAAKGGLACGLVFLACQGWLFAMLSGELRGLVLSGDLGLMWGAGLACLVPTCLCWLMVARSKAPLRLKGLIFAAMFLLWPACLLILSAMSALASLI